MLVNFVPFALSVLSAGVHDAISDLIDTKVHGNGDGSDGLVLRQVESIHDEIPACTKLSCMVVRA